MAAPWRPSRITSSTGSARGKSKITTDVGEEQEPEEERDEGLEDGDGGILLERRVRGAGTGDRHAVQDADSRGCEGRQGRSGG